MLLVLFITLGFIAGAVLAVAVIGGMIREAIREAILRGLGW